MKILANDGLSNQALLLLDNNRFEVLTTKVAQEQLSNYLNKNQIEILIVGNATKINQSIINTCPNLKIIGKLGLEMDNIIIDTNHPNTIKLLNTPNASVNAVAELAIGHLISGARYLHDSNRNMPLEGDTHFNQLKKVYSTGLELKGKTLGIIGFGKIGKAVAQKALALGMKVIATANERKQTSVEIEFYTGQKTTIPLDLMPLDDLLPLADFISLHIPPQEKYLLTATEFKRMKQGVGIINCSKGELINEVDLIEYLENKKISFAGLDVFQGEPNPAVQLLMHPDISLTPHIGGSTTETFENMSIEMAHKIIDLYT
ncbi:D-3-phosphoglycerate dehydrogenase [Flavobacterium columnare ATCC 49512]|uniref:D-3-phosphoglycerate dehydrogenase n=1 Tax=Flavobacterium columnare (strain ATCC 49512 / CIP 103533 / TG 44/87) TaxID=1041826 RepID=G8X992_FLACA|nr:NAD(P)-dependent oxidoreductase [Flavobacterium columnare]AEW85143.1 D-3-phosphoglycerate dehydrogenase [Flavobacterium columnare ATCC 49512]